MSSDTSPPVLPTIRRCFVLDVRLFSCSPSPRPPASIPPRQSPGLISCLYVLSGVRYSTTRGKTQNSPLANEKTNPALTPGIFVLENEGVVRNGITTALVHLEGIACCATSVTLPTHNISRVMASQAKKTPQIGVFCCVITPLPLRRPLWGP